MEEQKLCDYKSRRNRASLLQRKTNRVVKKLFATKEAFQNELLVYTMLQNTELPCAKVIATEENALILSELPGQNLVDCLQQQEASGVILWDVWEKLTAWLTAFHKQTGLVMTDVNLRNFLYDEENQILYGLDFEECAPGSMVIPAAAVAAFIRTYEPENTPLKQEISKFVLGRFARSCEMEVEALILESVRQEALILARRK